VLNSNHNSIRIKNTLLKS